MIVVLEIQIKDMDVEELSEEAGSLVANEDDQISLVKYNHLLNDTVANILAEVLEENPLPFQLADFQKLAIHAIGSLQNVVLVSPTGSGKMLVAYLSILVLQKKLGISSGVGIGCQPLSSIMNEKLKTSFLSTGTISMQGDLKSNTEFESEEDDQVSLSTSIEEFQDGRISCMIGHAESWASNTATTILDSLQEKGLILLTFVDEAHVPLKAHWDTFRHKMKQIPGQLRGKAVRGAPCLAMTATLTQQEIPELMETLGLRPTNTVLLQANPILSNHKYVRWVKGGVYVEAGYGILSPISRFFVQMT